MFVNRAWHTGAGSGKTKTLISRIQFLKAEGIPLDRMLVLTFSTAATKELSHRVHKAFPGPKKECAITGGQSSNVARYQICSNLLYTICFHIYSMYNGSRADM